MNTYAIIALILFILLSFCSIYLNSSIKKVMTLLKKNHIDIFMNFYTFKDIKNIYLLCKKDSGIAEKERRLIRHYFILLIISLPLFITFGIIIFTTDWYL